MKAVLMVFDPIDCNLIFNGEKTIDVRKVAPNLKPPYTVYMYMKAAKERFPLWEYITAYTNSKGEIVNGSQKVVGEFVCDRVKKYDIDLGGNYYRISDEDSVQACLDQTSLFKYGNGRDLYGWHISEPKLYDKPKELSEFRPWCKKSRMTEDNLEMCCKCNNAFFDEDGVFYDCGLTRPPRSWCYVEEIKDESVVSVL